LEFFVSPQIRGWVEIFHRSIWKPFQNFMQMGLSASFIPGFGMVFRQINQILEFLFVLWSKSKLHKKAMIKRKQWIKPCRIWSTPNFFLVWPNMSTQILNCWTPSQMTDKFNEYAFQSFYFYSERKN
jgi:hypothetical protein